MEENMKWNEKLIVTSRNSSEIIFTLLDYSCLQQIITDVSAFLLLLFHFSSRTLFEIHI